MFKMEAVICANCKGTTVKVGYVWQCSAGCNMEQKPTKDLLRTAELLGMKQENNFMFIYKGHDIDLSKCKSDKPVPVMKFIMDKFAVDLTKAHNDNIEVLFGGATDLKERMIREIVNYGWLDYSWKHHKENNTSERYRQYLRSLEDPAFIRTFTAVVERQHDMRKEAP